MNITFSGRVEKGEGMADRLGCPTANIAVEEGVIIPGLGVYVGEAELEGKRFPSLVCISDGRTGQNLKMEVHFLGENLDLLGKYLKVDLLEKMRDVIPFPGEMEMSEIIHDDLIKAKAWFENQDKTK